MENTTKIKLFGYDQIDECNEFIKTVDLKPTGGITLRDNGIFIIFTDKRTHKGMTKEEHLGSITDEIAKAEAELEDALLSYAESDNGFKTFNGKSGMKKVADGFLRQAALDKDTVEVKASKVHALKSLYMAINEGKVKVGNEAIEQFVAENPIFDPLKNSPYASVEVVNNGEENK